MTNNLITGIAPMQFKIEIYISEEKFIDLAETMSEGLDSHDLGDAMGFFLTYAMMNDMEFEIFEEEDIIVRGWIEFDSFQWEGIKQ